MGDMHICTEVLGNGVVSLHDPCLGPMYTLEWNLEECIQEACHLSLLQILSSFSEHNGHTTGTQTAGVYLGEAGGAFASP